MHIYIYAYLCFLSSFLKCEGTRLWVLRPQAASVGPAPSGCALRMHRQEADICVCVCICIYIYVCVCICIYIYICLCVYLHTYIYTHMSTCIHIYMCVLANVCIYVLRCVVSRSLLRLSVAIGVVSVSGSTRQSGRYGAFQFFLTL